MLERIEILTEEPSMEEFLKILLPKIVPSHWILDQNYFIRKHEGKSDLHKSIPKKMKAFSNNFYQKTGIFILQDQDSNNCKLLKQQIQNLCNINNPCPVLIRIICTELESWYLGDMQAIEQAYPTFKATTHQNKAKYRNPDNIANAGEELQKILPTFKKIESAKKIAHFIDIQNNKSTSFQQFVNGIQKFFP